MSFYSLAKIERKKATYNVIFGERSNGKTFALLKKAIINYVKNGKQFGYVRRWKEDVTGRRASQLFDGIKSEGIIEKETNGNYTGVYYLAGKFHLCNYDDNGKAVYGDTDVIGFCFALSDGEHDKSTSYPNIDLVIFDEFLTNRLYLNDEFISFMNTISTIVRRRTDVKIYMLGNTVNKYCPYFKEMGLENIPKMNQGSIDVYRYGDSPLTVAVEYCSSNQENKSPESNKYFAFNNSKLSMITGGAWELNIYPHLPVKYKPKDVLFNFFIDFSDQIYHCEVVSADDSTFIYIHNKTTPIKGGDDLIYAIEPNHKPNYVRNLFKPTNKLQSKITSLFTNSRVFYQDNNVGDAVSNFLKISKGL